MPWEVIMPWRQKTQTLFAKLATEVNCAYFMKMIGLNVTLNTKTKIFVNTFQITMALRTILVKTIST